MVSTLSSHVHPDLHLRRRQAFRYLRVRAQDIDDDQTATLAAFRARMASELGLTESKGFGELFFEGHLTHIFIMSCSDRPEALPYPRARIGTFQELLGYLGPPYGPSVHSC